jgi:dihydrofolate reductase
LEPSSVVPHSIKQVRARGDALRRAVDEIAAIGGAYIFRDTLDIADWLLITRVQLEPEGDTRFPCLDQSVWEEISRTEASEGKG